MHLLRIGETVVDRDVDKAFSSLLVTQHQPSETLASELARVFFCHGRRGCYGERHKSEQRARLATRTQHTAALMGEEEEMSDRELRGKVLVGGRSHEISVYRKSKSVWIAVGDYMGVTITVQDRSEGAALKRWGEAAEHQGN